MARSKPDGIEITKINITGISRFLNDKMTTPEVLLFHLSIKYLLIPFLYILELY